MNLILLTQRLVLRPLEMSDAETMFAYRSDPIVSRYQTWEPPDTDAIIKFIQSLQNIKPDTEDTWYQLAITLKENGEMIGDCGIHFPSGSTQEVDVGITLMQTQQGKGYASEALACLLAYAFQDLCKESVVGIADSRNIASINMLIKIGMKEEIEKRENVFLKDEWLEEVHYRITKQEWTQTQQNK
ncbi:MAG: GNAT family N-acetyltransferase [Anaerolineaceae bacterium]|nr:GNAT family N-acetyltransferase [Anaerolineaceae bacterium]